MSIVKRFNRLLGLEKIDVLVDEKDKSRHIVITDIPESLPQGKSSFLIEVSPYMRKGIELQIDFIDSRGNSIYVEPVSNYLEGTSRTVSVEVYSTTAPGVATMIIVGELEGLPLDSGNFSETEDIPDEFKGVYNVRLTKEVIINSAEINVQPIKFYSSPRLTAVEKRFGSMEREVISGETISSAFSVIGQPTQQEDFSIYTPNESEVDALGAGVNEIDEVPKPPDGDIKGDDADKERLKRFTKKRRVRTDSRFKRSKRIRKRRSPEEYPYIFTINDNNHEFTTEEIGGEIKFSNLKNIYNSSQLNEASLKSDVSFNVVTNPDDENFPTHYTASIAKLKDNKTALVNTPFTKQDDFGNYRLLPMEATGVVHYTKEPSASYSLTNIVSYADVTLSHLRTFSGEVFKAKVYVRAEGSFDDYKLLAEVPVESPELMINENSVGIGERTGYFVSESDLNTYWEKFGGTNGLNTATPTTTASFDNDGSLDSVLISGSISSFTDQIRFEQKDAYRFNLTKGIDYDLSFKAVGEKGTDDRALLMVYVSGSSVKQQSDLHFDEVSKKDVDEPSQYGKRMGVLEINVGDDVKKEFGLIRHNFNPNLSGNAKVQFRIISGKWNISDISVVPSTDTGFSPSFVRFQQELPPELVHKRPETLEFLTEFYDINNNLADEVAVTTGSIFTGANIVITGDDNVISHNMFIGGDTTGSGIHMGGTSSTLPDDNYSDGATGSGFIRSIGYLGFESASNSALGGKKGFMIYSGSVLPNSGEDYKGVGLELVGASGSLKFRTNPSVFDVQADSFFVGKTTTQFISGSNEQIEISSSNFHLDNAGNVDMSGTITATAGQIGGFDIKSGQLAAGVGNSAVTMSGADKLIRMGSGSVFNIGDIDGILMGQDTDGKYKFGVGSGDSYLFFDGTSVNIRSEDINVTASVFEVDVDVFKLSANNLFVSSSQGGFISAGNPRPTGITGTNKGVFIGGNNPTDNKPKFLAGDAAGARLSFDGDNIFMSSSGFFLGSSTQFVSGSNGNIEISSSNFHLDNAGNVVMSGKVTADEGSIGGFNITNDALSSTNFFISGSATGNNRFISSTNFNVKASGDVTASALDLTGGSVAGLNVSAGEISVGSILKLKDSGQITGSSVLFSGGTIGGFTLSSGGLIDSADSIQLSSTQASMSLGTGQEVLLRGNSNSPFISIQPSVALVDKSYAETGVFFGVAGGSTPLFSAVGSGGHFKFDGSTIDISTNTAVISGSSIRLESPKFFLGKASTNFVSGSNGNIEISSSQFHLTRQGDVTGSAILLGNKGAGQFLQFVNNTLTVQGAITADSISVPSAAPTPSSSIKADGLLTTVSASIGGFDIVSSEIKDKDDNLRLKSSGQITGSKVLFTAGKIAAWNISGNNISSTGGGIRLNGNGNSAEISINSHTFGNEGIQLGFNSGSPRFYAGNGGNNFLRYDTSNGVNIQTTKANISGSEITLQTPKFFLGESSQFISGSNGNIEISSSNFHLDSSGNVVMSGNVSATTGTIGGFTIGDELTSTAGTLILRGASGIITASNALISGDITAQKITANTAGTIANFNINSVEIASSNNNLRLKASGQITASEAQITGKITATSGQIAGFTINGTKLQQGTSFNLDGDASADFFISSSDFQVTPSGDVSGSKVLFTGGRIAGWSLSSNRFSDLDDTVRIDSSAGSISIKNHSFGQSGIQLQHNAGTTRFHAGNGSNRFIKFDGSDVDIQTAKLTASGSSINLGAPSFRLGSATNFISGSGGTLLIQNSGTTTLSGSAVTIETPKFFLGKKGSQFVSGSNNLIEISSSKFHLKNNGDVIMNNITASNANVSGKMTATSGEIGGFTIGDDLSNSAGSTLKLKGSSGQITASAANITGDIVANTITANTAGTIANFEISSAEIKSSNNLLRLKSNGQISASEAQITGKVTATSGQIAGFSIDGNTLTATNFTLDASGKRITLGTGTNIFIADGDEGIQLGHGTFASAPFSVTKAGLLKATSGTIGGWTLSDTQISSNNLILDSAGVIQTSDYASNVKGWRLSPANGGEAEFQNVKIRGTLSTAVFEKETVNAVGGQLYIANSTALTGSATVAATETTMSVVNVGGFVANEVLSAKKVSATGFATEYMLVQSASRDFPSSETDFRGKLYVVRGYNSGSLGASGSLGDAANISQSFEPGQVIVSTGKIGTGFIRLNANPNDVTTPYIDIVERTGSGVYDVDLKARLGDLSGLSSGLLYGNASPGFGLFTENVFLQGAITATTGSFTGKVHVGTTDGIVIDGNAKKLFQGTGTHNNSDTGFYMDSTGKFSLGDKLVWDSSTETLTITGTINITAGSGFATAASVSGSFPNASSVSASLNASSSALQTNIDTVESNVSGAFTSTSASLSSTIMTNADGKIVKTPSTSGLTGLILKSTHLGFADSGTFKAFIGSTGNFLFKNDDSNLISFGQSTSVGDGTTTSNLVIKAANAYLSGSSINLLTSRFFFGDNSNFISGSGGDLKIFSTGETTLSGSSVTLETPKFFLGKKGSQFISGSNNNIEISSSKLHLQNDGNVIMNKITASAANISGDITADTITANTAGTIANFNIDSNEIKSSNNQLRLKQTGEITASNYLFNGSGVITGSVTIGTSATILGTLSAGSIATPSSGPPFKSQINSEGFARFTSASIAGWHIDSTTISSPDEKVIIDSSNKRITINNTTFGSEGIQLDYNGGTPRFFAGSGSKFVKFDGSDVDIKTEKLTASGSSINLGAPSFRLGSATNFISGSGGDLVIQTTGTTTLSGSAIDIKTPKFYLGEGSSQFISGSNGNIEISSSQFHFDPANNKVAISGSITATTGKIGGMLLENNKLKSQYGDGSTINHTVTVSSGVYHIDGVSQPTLELKVGNTYRFDNSDGTNGGHPFRFSETSDGSTYTTGVTVSGTEGQPDSYVEISITASTPTTLYYKCNSHGSMGGQLNIITIGTLELNGVNGQITGSNVLISGGKIAGSDLTIDVPNVTISGSSVNIQTPKFFLGSNTQFISGSNSNIEISSSAFHLNPADNTMVLSGSITATDGNIGGFTIDSDEIKSTALAGETVNYTVTNDSSNYYIIDGVNQPALTFVVGNTYVFTMDSGVMSGHPFRIGTAVQGGTISDGVTVTSTSLTIVVSASTPTSLYYFCTIHGGMGNSITVNAGIPKLLLNGELGQISASAANITGDIVANTITANTAGTIGGFTLDSVGLKSSDGGLILSGSGQITASAAQITGDITANTITANTAGTIGGFTLNSVGLISSDGNLVLSGSGQITASAAQISGKITTDDISATGGSIGGFTIDGSHIKSSNGDNFELDNQGGATVGILRMGLNASSQTRTSGTGVYMDGNSNFRVGKAGHGRIEFDGSNLQISSSGFILGQSGSGATTGAFISGSKEGKLEISSSKFHVQPDGDTIMRGKITADSGEIAGFNIIRDNAQSAKLISEESDTLHTSRMILSPATGSHKTGIFRLESIGAAGQDFENQAQIFDVVHPKSGFAGDPQTLTMASVINNLQLDGLSSGLINYTYNKISGSYIQFENNSNVTSSKMSIVAQTNNKSSKMIIESGATKNVLTGIGGLQEGNGVLNQPFSRLYVDGYTNAQSSSLAAFDNQNSVGVVIDIVRRSDGSRMPGFFVGRRDKAFIFLNGRPSAEELHISSSNFHLNGVDGSVTMQGKITSNEGSIAGFSITETAISSSNGDLILGSNGQITAKGTSHQIGGTITADVINATGSGIIGGFTIDANEIADGTDISLSSQHKRLTINDSTFGNTGVQIEHNSGTPRFFAGSSTGGFVKFDGANFQFSSSGFILGQSGSLDASTGKFPNVSFISGSDSNIEISSSNFHLQKSGNVKVTGDITANTITANNAGTIANFEINSSEIKSSNNNLRLKSSGQITASAADISGKITADSGQIATFSITSGSIDSNTSNSKRGLKLEPGTSIRGYGNTVHSTTTIQGRFSFGVGAVAAPAGASTRFEINEAPIDYVVGGESPL